MVTVVLHDERYVMEPTPTAINSSTYDPVMMVTNGGRGPRRTARRTNPVLIALAPQE